MIIDAITWTVFVSQQLAVVLSVPLMILGLAVLWRLFRYLGR